MADTKREFSVWESRQNDTIIAFYVTDRFDDEKNCEHRTVAVFPISDKHDKLDQQRRARDYRDYMNKLLEASEQAYEHNKLINILKS